jgi:lipopolysaccharide assembly protein A
MPVFRGFIALVFILLGILFAALNRDAVVLDLGFLVIESRLGLLLLATFLLGFLIGGVLLMASMVWPLRRQLDRLRHPGAPGQSQDPKSLDPRNTDPP